MCSETSNVQRAISNRESAGGGARTHTILRSLDFESSASANSATPAFHSETLFYRWETAYFVHFHCNTNLKISRASNSDTASDDRRQMQNSDFRFNWFLQCPKLDSQRSDCAEYPNGIFEHWSRWCIVALACHAIKAPGKTVSMTKSFSNQWGQNSRGFAQGASRMLHGWSDPFRVSPKSMLLSCRVQKG